MEEGSSKFQLPDDLGNVAADGTGYDEKDNS